jgi:nucleoside-diphosphate-sugar epimerase
MGELDLVTGGAGYFGSLLVRRLHSEGRRVRVLDICTTDELPDDVEFFQADIRDQSEVRRACKGVGVVHHNVAMVPLAKDPAAFVAVNELGTRNLLDAALSCRVRKVVHMSSSAVYGAPQDNPVTESTVPRPQEAYGKAKLAAESLCHAYQALGLDVTIFRPRTILGHGRLGIFQILFEWVREGKNLPVLGGGDNLYQFVHADDLADAAIAAAERSGPATYNIGGADFCSMRKTLEGLLCHAGTGGRVVSLPMSWAECAMNLTSGVGLSPLAGYHSLMYGRSLYFDIAKAKSELGYVPKWGNVEMICQSYDWYLAHRSQVLSRGGTSHHRSPVRQRILNVVGWALGLAP